MQQVSKGKAGAVYEAIDNSTGELLAILDSDISVDPETLPTFFSILEEGRADFVNGWGILRASNTTPCLVMRFEADTKEEMFYIQEEFIKEIIKIDPTLEIPSGKK